MTSAGSVLVVVNSGDQDYRDYVLRAALAGLAAAAGTRPDQPVRPA